MKKLFLLIAIFFQVEFSFCQKSIPFSIESIGPFKLEMRKIEVEKILNKKINISLTEGNIPSAINVTYRNCVLTLEFENRENNKNLDSLTLCTIKTKSKNFKTLSGIGIGSTKLDLFNAYSDDYEIFMYHVFERNIIKDTYYRVRDKNTFRVRNYDVNTQLEFSLYKNKVTEIALQFNEGEGD